MILKLIVLTQTYKARNEISPYLFHLSPVIHIINFDHFFIVYISSIGSFLAYCLLQALRFGIEMKKEQEKKLPNQARLWPLLQDLPLLMVKENLGSQGKFELVHRKRKKKTYFDRSQCCSNRSKISSILEKSYNYS